jgi:hypothetical protein
MPFGGTVIGGDPRYEGLWSRAAATRRSRFVAAEFNAYKESFPENEACVSALATLIDVGPETAREAAVHYKRDPGSLALLSMNGSGASRLLYADATAANDPESSLLAMKEAVRMAGLTLQEGFSTCIVLAVRRDRPDRSLQLVNMLAGIDAGRLAIGPAYRYYCIGGLPLSMLRRASSIGLRRCASLRSLTVELRREAESCAKGLLVIAIGNRVGLGGELRSWAASASDREAIYGI